MWRNMLAGGQTGAMWVLSYSLLLGQITRSTKNNNDCIVFELQGTIDTIQCQF